MTLRRSRPRSPFVVPAPALRRLLAHRGAERARERDLQDLVHRPHRPHRQLVGDVARDLGQLGGVGEGDDHGGDAGARGGQQLLFQPADRQHLAAQGELAGHRHLVAHRDPGDERDQRAGHRHAGRRSVLGHAARRDVDVDLAPRVELAVPGPAPARARARTTAPPAPTPSSRRRAGRSGSATPCPPSSAPRSAAPRRRRASRRGR